MLAVHVRLRSGTYDAGAVDDPRQPEWPPHPARAFCALVGSSPDEAEWAALRWLENQPPPEVHAPDAIDQSAHDQYLMGNTIGKGGPTLPAREAAIRIKPRLMPASDRFSLVWPEATPDPATLSALQALAWRVPYIGRSTSSAEVSFSLEAPAASDDLVVYEPVPLRESKIDLRAPYPGYCDRLDVAHDSGTLAWEESRWVGYRARRPEATDVETVISGPFTDVLPFAFTASALHGSHVRTVAERLRDATMALIPDPVPDPISGHGPSGQVHVAYLGLPNVGVPTTLPGVEGIRFTDRNPHADGRLLGVALAVPDDDATSAALYRYLCPPRDLGLDHLAMGPMGRFDLDPRLSGGGAWGLRPSRWVGPAQWWATATPVVLDRHSRPNDLDASRQVREALARAGYPEPLEVHAQSAPILHGGIRVQRNQVQRRAGLPTKPWTHAWVRFPTKVSGPVLAGSMRYRGLGLFAPLPDPTPTSEAGNGGLDDGAKEGGSP